MRVIDGPRPGRATILLVAFLLVVIAALIAFGVTTSDFISRLLAIPISKSHLSPIDDFGCGSMAKVIALDTPIAIVRWA